MYQSYWSLVLRRHASPRESGLREKVVREKRQFIAQPDAAVFLRPDRKIMGPTGFNPELLTKLDLA